MSHLGRGRRVGRASDLGSSVVNAAVSDLDWRRTVPGERGARDAAIFRSFDER